MTEGEYGKEEGAVAVSEKKEFSAVFAAAVGILGTGHEPSGEERKNRVHCRV